MIDLDSSVFMNFKRYTKQDVINCFKADMRQSSFENIVRNEEDVSNKQQILMLLSSKTAVGLHHHFLEELCSLLPVLPRDGRIV